MFLSGRTSEEKVQDYLKFVKSIGPEITNNNIGLVLNYSDEQALSFLHKMDYSVVKAKFYLLFPTLYRYNQYHHENPVEISEKEMEEKITYFFEQMQETKSSQQEKWKTELQELLSERIMISKLAAFLDQGKYPGIKNDIPDFLKEMYDKMAKFSREIKKVLASKTKLETLEKFQKTSLEYKIVSPEMETLEEGIEKSKHWLNKLDHLEKKGFTIRGLEGLLNEYKSIPLEYASFNKLKRMYDDAKDLLDKLPNYSKSTKTRNNSTIEKIPLDTANKYARRILNFNVRCEEVSMPKLI